MHVTLIILVVRQILLYCHLGSTKPILLERSILEGALFVTVLQFLQDGSP